MHNQIVNILSPRFVANVREKGSTFFWAGRVSAFSGTANSASGTIRDHQSHRATILYKDGDLLLGCDCKYFQENGNCHHLWALILAIATKDTGVLSDLDKHFSSQASSAEKKPKPSLKREPKARWEILLESVDLHQQEVSLDSRTERRFLYRMESVGAHEGYRMILHVEFQDKRKNGSWGAPKAFNLSRLEDDNLTDEQDRSILLSLRGCPRPWESSRSPHTSPFSLTDEQVAMLMPFLAASGRLAARESDVDRFVSFDESAIWNFFLRLKKAGESDYELTGLLRRDNVEESLASPLILMRAGWIIFRTQVARLNHGGAFHWIQSLRHTGAVKIKESELKDFLTKLAQAARLPPIELSSDLNVAVESAAPKIILRIHPDSQRPGLVLANLFFAYGDQIFAENDKDSAQLDWDKRILLCRDGPLESKARNQLLDAGFEAHGSSSPATDTYELYSRDLPASIQALLPHGWSIEASGKIYRSAKAFKLNVSSGTDWFDLNGRAEFDGSGISLPALLKAIRTGNSTVQLDDGSLGVVPEDWLRRISTLAALGEDVGDMVRFQRDQALLLDALLAEQENVDVDDAFETIRAELRNFKQVEALDAPPGFQGELRPYQREGLGWFEFLRRFTFGGCLADDMGLGKTVQVLALLEKRRQEKAGPSLVVVPRSLLFNWREEARRFTPQLRILEHSGIGRARSSGHLKDFDVILTTYGTLRRDAILLKELTFDYVILDEAQAIKNADTHSAKAARILKGKHRLALSGTPIENHLGELWSLFQFLNPGMMGRAKAFEAFTGTDVSPEARKIIARSLRPFILRRTKGEVAKELPERLEQTIHCDLPAHQRKLYDELRDFYRKSLLHQVDAKGLARSKIMVLEALLRLRQAACHPALVDKKHEEEECAKLQALLPQLAEVTQEGHKALVFSQFTSFLRLVKKHLDAAGMTYEYLDGKTSDRQAKVDRFQKDPECRIFLISLRAGGLGLNLTAAEYVFLLDPWWNPAVEAQAIDRAHRIGQTQKVFAYRLIARDTIEEKVLQLQASKRDLAAAIITEDQSILRNLTREDLEMLLG